MDGLGGKGGGLGKSWGWLWVVMGMVVEGGGLEEEGLR